MHKKGGKALVVIYKYAEKATGMKTAGGLKGYTPDFKNTV